MGNRLIAKAKRFLRSSGGQQRLKHAARRAYNRYKVRKVR